MQVHFFHSIVNFLPILGTDKLPDNSKRGFPPNLVEKSTMQYIQRVMSIKIKFYTYIMQ